MTDPSFDFLAKRKLEPGRVIFVFDKRVANNPTFTGTETGEKRYPQVERQSLDQAVAIIVLDEDIANVKNEAEKYGIPILTKEDWIGYAYPPDHVGGLTWVEE